MADLQKVLNLLINMEQKMKRTKEELESFCKRWLKDWSTLEPEVVLPYYDEEVYFWEPAVGKGIRGSKAFKEYLVKIRARFSQANWELKELFPIEGGFVFSWEARLTQAKTGAEEGVHGLELVMFRGEKIVRNEVYYDRTPLLKGKVVR